MCEHDKKITANFNLNFAVLWVSNSFLIKMPVMLLIPKLDPRPAYQLLIYLSGSDIFTPSFYSVTNKIIEHRYLH